MNNKTKNIIKFGILLVLIIGVIFIVKMYDLAEKFSITYIQDFVGGYGAWGPLVFILIYIVATIFFLPGTPVTLASGLLFGTFFGGLYTVIGATIGASIAFLISRYLGIGFVQRIVEKRFKKLKEYDEKLEKNGFFVTLLLRLVPIFPFNGLNFALGVTKVRFRHYFLATLFGIIPGTFVYANVGGNLENLNGPQFYIAIGLLILLIIGSWYAKKHIEKKQYKETQ